MNRIKIAAALLLNSQRQVLLVRKKNTIFFMQAGGKLEPNEQPKQALLRELHEELNIQLEPSQLEFIGQFSAPAANEENHTVEADIYLCFYDGEVRASQEIAQATWFGLEQTQTVPLAALTQQFVLPIAKQLLTIKDGF
ncbi:NUDIX domain-containing protein [Pseudomonas sp. F1_0610]|uniref:NUDIX hydrolase n=1 Tax=Pseudomonas sp. F1_0610 TaxID=3114284 RepID=UPI0039C11EA5